MDRPAVAIMKHNNPCGVAVADTLARAYERANMADRVAAFGGCIALNRPCDRETATQIAANYAEVVVAQDYEEGSVGILAARKNLRIVKIAAMDRLASFAGEIFIDFKSLMDGGLVLQTSFVPRARRREDLAIAEVEQGGGGTVRVKREPTEAEYEDMLFGWMVESGVTSNSVIYVKDGVTVGIGTGEQDRVGVAEIARDKAYRKLADRIAWERWGTPYNDLAVEDRRREVDAEVEERRGGLPGCTMVSDAFFPFRDGVDVGLREGVTAVIQPGGSQNDIEVIEAVNERGATMVFTGQRSFRH